MAAVKGFHCLLQIFKSGFFVRWEAIFSRISQGSREHHTMWQCFSNEALMMGSYFDKGCQLSTSFIFWLVFFLFWCFGETCCLYFIYLSTPIISIKILNFSRSNWPKLPSNFLFFPTKSFNLITLTPTLTLKMEAVRSRHDRTNVPSS